MEVRMAVSRDTEPTNELGVCRAQAYAAGYGGTQIAF